MKWKQPRVTLKTVAQECGYSINTVSRAMRNDDRISETTRQKIQAAAQELGYIPNNLASSLRSGKSRIIAIIIEHAHNPHYTFLIDDLVGCLRACGYIPMLLFTHNDEQTEEQMLDLTRSLSAEGIILFAHGEKTASAGLLQSLSIPVVLVDRRIPGMETDLVCVDDYRGGYLAGETLAAIGHARFALLAGPVLNDTQIRRQAGFFDALAEKGIGSEGVRIFSFEAVGDAISRNGILELLSPVDYTAVISYNDEIAYHVINALRRNHYRVPEDISVCSFDHIHRDMPYLPPLTSISCPQDCSMAETVVRFLDNRLEHPEHPVQIREFPVVLYDEGTIRALQR